MRKLGSIQTVNTVEPIPGADAVERIRVLGWWVVARKGEFRQGDRVVYCELDSLLPERPEFEFLRASSFKPAVRDENGVEIQPAGFRIKTIRLRGQVSQGICFPTTILSLGTRCDEGTDVTALLGIRKWEPPIPLGMTGKVKGGFPGFLPKTDETRVQVLEGVLQRHRGKTFHMTEKLDGASFSAFVRKGEFGICSRNFWLDESDDRSVLVRLSRRLELESRLKQAAAKHCFPLAIQGEVIGPGMQGNKYELGEVSLRVFNVLDLAGGSLLEQPRMLDVLGEMQLESVPQLGTLVLEVGVDELIALSQGTSMLNPKVQREGLVFRPLVEEYEPELGGRVSFKAINPKFLLKYDE